MRPPMVTRFCVRSGAQAIVAIFNGLGVAFSNYVGPALVPTHASSAEQRQGMGTHPALSLTGTSVVWLRDHSALVYGYVVG